jgi:hypothetical protein
MGLAENPAALPISSERDYAIREMQSSCAFFEDDKIYNEMAKICSYCDFS